MYQKAGCLILAVLALCCIVFAYGEHPEETVLYDASEILGYESHYYLYDTAFFEAEDQEQGCVEKIRYTTEVYGEELKRWANVYLPYGYDEEQAYPVIYFFHGGGCDQKTILENPYTKNALDHMISTGAAQPFILVAPTYYYNARTKEHDMDLFTAEMLHDLMPAVESTYHTYAQTTDEAGFAASRDYRALCGFSTGSGYVWHMFPSMISYAGWFLPCSGAAVSDTEYDALIRTAASYSGQFFIYLSSGGREDVAYPHCIDLVRRLQEENVFRYGVDEDCNFFYSLSENEHLDNCVRYYLFNAFCDGLFAEQ